jgi:alkaline phosphatase
MFTQLGFPDAAFWVSSAQSELGAKLKDEEARIEAVARNTVFFLGDGMSLSTITAARILKGQLGKSPFGEEATLSFEEFPNIGISKVCPFSMFTFSS